MSKLKIGDIIIVAVILFTAVLPFAFSSGGEYAVIYVNGEIYKKIGLKENAEEEINGTVIKVENGEAFFLSSTCPDKLCEKCGRLYKTGNIASCVPNGVTLVIEGGSDQADGVTW